MKLTSNLLPRKIHRLLTESLSYRPVVCVVGPRQAGKTTLVQQLSERRTYVSLDDDASLALAKQDPIGFFNTLDTPCTIDEIQRVPELLTTIKLAVDEDRTPGRFLLTGSANLLLLPQTKESLAGRVGMVSLYPLSESEKEQTKSIFLSELISSDLHPRLPTRSNDSTSDLVDRLLFGGYPETTQFTLNQTRRWHREYLYSVINNDIQSIFRIREIAKLELLLRVLATRTAPLLNIANLTKIVQLRRETLESYLSILERLFLIRLLPAWAQNPTKRLVKSPKLHFVDSGIAATLAGYGPEDWEMDRTAIGPLLESYVVQQLIAQASWIDEDLTFSHYRDKDQYEVDLVISKGKSVWGIEIKATSTLSNIKPNGLIRLAKSCEPNFKLGVVFYNGHATVPLKDNRIFAVPIEALWSDTE